MVPPSSRSQNILMGTKAIRRPVSTLLDSDVWSIVEGEDVNVQQNDAIKLKISR